MTDAGTQKKDSEAEQQAQTSLLPQQWIAKLWSLVGLQEAKSLRDALEGALQADGAQGEGFFSPPKSGRCSAGCCGSGSCASKR